MLPYHGIAARKGTIFASAFFKTRIRVIELRFCLLLSFLAVLLAGCASSFAQSAINDAGHANKIAPELIELHREYSSYLASGKRGVFKPANSLVQITDDRVIVDAVASGDVNALKADLEALGMQQAVSFGRVVSGQLPILAIPSLVALPSLNLARAAIPVSRTPGIPHFEN